MTRFRWPLLVCALWLSSACSHISYEANPRATQPTGPVALERVQVLEAAPDYPYEDIGEITIYLINRSGPVPDEEILQALRKEASERGCEVVHIRGRGGRRSLPGGATSLREVTSETKKLRGACIRPLSANILRSSPTPSSRRARSFFGSAFAAARGATPASCGFGSAPAGGSYFPATSCGP